MFTEFPSNQGQYVVQKILSFQSGKIYLLEQSVFGLFLQNRHISFRITIIIENATGAFLAWCSTIALLIMFP